MTITTTTRAEPFGAVLRVGRPGGGGLSSEEHTALLSEVRSNPGTTAKLEVEVVSYLQPEGKPNRNFVRFRDGALKKIAASFKGAPVLRDHEQNDSMARAGTISASELVDHNGSPAIRQTLVLVKPWAIEGVLDGTLDRFSIGWRATGPIVCTACKAEYASSMWGSYPSCEHMPGDTVTTKRGVTVCEAEYSSAEGVEVSAVSVPAVLGTGVDEIRAALSAAATADHRSKRSVPMLKTLLPILMLAATADEGDVVTAIEKLKTENDGARAALKDALDRVVGLTEKLEAQEKAVASTRIEAAVKQALAEKRVAEGGNVHAHVKKLADRGDLEGLTAYLADLPAGSAGAIGEPMASLTPDPKPRAAVELSADQKKTAKQLRITEAQYLAQLNKGA